MAWHIVYIVCILKTGEFSKTSFYTANKDLLNYSQRVCRKDLITTRSLQDRLKGPMFIIKTTQVCSFCSLMNGQISRAGMLKSNQSLFSKKPKNMQRRAAYTFDFKYP